MKRLSLSMVLAIAVAQLPASALAVELQFQATYMRGVDPLTTEKLAVIDPGERNPHRRRWAVSRQTELDGLDAVQMPDGRFGVRALGLRTQSQSFVRGPGPWYRPLTEFPCGREPQQWFGTEEGTRIAAEFAAKAWTEELQARKLKLDLLLQKVSASTAEIAQLMARHLFNAWLKDATAEWRANGVRRAELAEWKTYLEQSAQQKLCGREIKKQAVAWKDMMEAPSADKPPRLLARAPARRWNGLFSVRLNITIRGQSLNGQFLIDSGAEKSILSPVFLENQGVLPVWTELPGSIPELVTWGGRWGRPGLARVATVDQVELSGYALPLKEFLLQGTDFFDKPESVTTCCDGVLGLDFLRIGAVELTSGPPNEVKLWAVEGFHMPGGRWVEVAAASPGVISSQDCAGKGGGRSDSFKSLRWNSGDVGALELASHLSAGTRGWDLQCHGTSIAKEVPAYASSSKISDVGMKVLGRGRVAFDLPHGRIWFEESALDEPVARNRSGLVLQYKIRGDERVLQVLDIRPGTPASKLAKDGLRKGLIISKVDGKSAYELDQWEVDQRLSGVRGDIVTLQWETKKMSKIVPLPVKLSAK